MIDRIKQSIPALGKGLAMQAAPGIAAGYINELFKQMNVTVDLVVKDVQQNNSLKDRMTEGQKKNLRKAARLVKNMDFLTVELVAQGIAEDFPDVATLFISWERAGHWLKRQLEDIKEQAFSD